MMAPGRSTVPSPPQEEQSDPAPALNVVITGASGFLGRAIVRDFFNDGTNSLLGNDTAITLFLPIRDKHGRRGEDRCDDLFSDASQFVKNDAPAAKQQEATAGSTKNTNRFPVIRWLEPGAHNWPTDTHIVIFAAFDTSFYGDVGQRIRSSVCPIVEGLRHCATSMPLLQRVLVVSTAFVLPPLPFSTKREGHHVTDWTTAPLRDDDSWEQAGTSTNSRNPMQVYEDFLSDKHQGHVNTPKDGRHTSSKKDKVNSQDHESSPIKAHRHINCYIYCKTLVEAIIETSPEFCSLRARISILRPSIIGASLDGRQWNIKSPGCAAMFLSCESKCFGNALPWWGTLDLVPVCLVARAAVQAATKKIVKIPSSDNHRREINDGGVDICYATNGVSFSPQVMSASCGKMAMLLPPSWLHGIQTLECAVAGLFGFGKRLNQYYTCYEYFSSHTWDFPTEFGLDVPSLLRFSEHKSWVQREKDRQQARKAQQGKSNSTSSNVIACAIVACVAVSLGRHFCPSGLGCLADRDYAFVVNLEIIFRESITPALVEFVPYSGLAYLCFVLVAVLIRHWLVGRRDILLVPPKVLMAHNLFLVLQSTILLCLGLDGYLFARGHQSLSGATVLDVLISGEKYEYPYLSLALGTFLLSKLYEWVDTMILIARNKPLGLLHLWHHGTIYMGFYHGFWTGAVSWIGTMNSLVHVIMYTYYSGICKRWIRPIARYITTLQILHLVGGVSLALATILWPADPFLSVDEAVAARLLLSGIYMSPSSSSVMVGMLLTSYVLLFMAYYGRRYYAEGKGSLWILLGGKAFQTFVKEQVQDRTFGIFRHYQFTQQTYMKSTARAVRWVEGYLILQGLLVPLDDSETGVRDEKNHRIHASHRSCFKSSFEFAPHPSIWEARLYNCFLHGGIIGFSVIWPTWALLFRSPRDLTPLAVLALGMIAVMSAIFLKQVRWIVDLASETTPRQEEHAKIEPQLKCTSPTEVVDCVVVLPVYNEPRELLQEAIFELTKNQCVLRSGCSGSQIEKPMVRLHVVLALEGKYWDEKTSAELLEWQSALIKLGKPARVVADRGACSWDNSEAIPNASDVLGGDDRIVFFGENGQCYHQRKLKSDPDFMSATEEPSISAQSYFVSLKSSTVTQGSDSSHGMTSLHFFMHPAPGSPGRRADETQSCGSNIHWATRQLCGFFATERLHEVSGSEVLLPFPGKAVVLKMDAGVIPSRNLLDEISGAFWERWLSHQSKDHFLFGTSRAVADQPLNGGCDAVHPHPWPQPPSADVLAQQRRALLSNFLDEESLLPPLHLHPLVVDPFGYATSAPITRFYSVLAGAGQILITGMKWHCYCCYAVPLYDLVRAGLYHPDFAADELAMSAGMLRASTTGTVAFLPLRTIVWKAVPIGLAETLRQQLRFEGMCHWTNPWLLKTLGVTVVPKMVLRHMMVAGQASMFLISIVGYVAGAFTPVEDNNKLLSLVLIQVTFLCTVVAIWSLVQWRIVVQYVGRELAPRMALVDGTESDVQHQRLGAQILCVFHTVVVGAPICVVVAVGIFWRALWIALVGGWQGQTHTCRKKVACTPLR